MSDFFNQHGKVYEIKDFCPWCIMLAGVAVIVAAIFLSSLPQDNHSQFSWANLHLFIIQNLVYVFAGAQKLDLLSLLCIAGLMFGIFIFWDGFSDRKKNPNYIVDARNNLFFIPREDDPYCKLSEIDVVNKRQESRTERKSYYEDRRTKYRTVTKYSY